jgi:hypothetical protein
MRLGVLKAFSENAFSEYTEEGEESQPLKLLWKLADTL